jgi:bidirectional [NiFe] hydrogenase diaphorase subunit
MAGPDVPATRGAARGEEPHPSGDERFAMLDKSLRKARFAQDQLIEVLHAAQGVFGYLSEDVLIYLARALKLPPSRVYGVATFYNLFTFEAPGDHTATVCTGTACFVKGADDIVAALSERFGISAGETTEDRRFSLAVARCLGSCGLAPVVVLDGGVRGHLGADEVLAEVRANLAADGDGSEPTAVGSAPSSAADDSETIAAAAAPSGTSR